MHERIGKYHVIREAGSGGFGTVYEGYDVELDRNVAIKIGAGDEQQSERFRREARVVSQLQHRNVALVFDFGYDEVAGVYYLVEEFLSGVDLDRKIEDGDRLPPSLRLRYLIGIAQGLEFVHGRGLIHRDLSPRNVRVLHDHTIKIMDFGLAKDVADSTLTLAGDNFGTIGYTAPEQVTGMSSVDHRTDIFSFGVIAYELLTCTNPFLAENMGSFIRKVHGLEPRPVRELWTDCPSELATAIEKCMEKDPDARVDSCSEVLPVLKDALRFLRDHDVPAPFAPPAATGDGFSDALAAVNRRLDGGRAGDVDSARPTRDVSVSRTRPLPLPRSRRATNFPGSAERVSRIVTSLPGLLAVAVVVAGLIVLVVVTLVPDDASPPGSAEAVMPSVEPAAAAGVEPTPVFPLRCESAAIAGGPSILLHGPLPADLVGLSHCYVVRTPGWSHGVKLRRDCSGEAFRYLDRDEVDPGQSYVYRVQAAAAAGEILAQASCSSVATPPSPS